MGDKQQGLAESEVWSPGVAFTGRKRNCYLREIKRINETVS